MRIIIFILLINSFTLSVLSQPHLSKIELGIDNAYVPIVNESRNSILISSFEIDKSSNGLTPFLCLFDMNTGKHKKIKIAKLESAIGWINGLNLIMEYDDYKSTPKMINTNGKFILINPETNEIDSVFIPLDINYHCYFLMGVYRENIFYESDSSCENNRYYRYSNLTGKTEEIRSLRGLNIHSIGKSSLSFTPEGDTMFFFVNNEETIEMRSYNGKEMRILFSTKINGSIESFCYSHSRNSIFYVVNDSDKSFIQKFDISSNELSNVMVFSDSVKCNSIVSYKNKIITGLEIPSKKVNEIKISNRKKINIDFYLNTTCNLYYLEDE